MEPGACLLVLGASGSGKSTLARALAGLLPTGEGAVRSGRLETAGLDTEMVATSVLAARVGLVFQHPASQIVMERVEDDVAFGLENRAWSRAGMASRVPEALAEIGLASEARRRALTLSGGQQQRLALAGVMAPRPTVLVLDEPTASLDPMAAAALMARLAELRAARAATVVLVEHAVELAWPLADRILAFSRDGRPLCFGSPDEVLASHSESLKGEGIWLPGELASRSSSRDSGTTACGTPVVEARDLRFAYERDREVLRGLDLAVKPGERVALLGPNGSGKSTLARLLVGLLRPTRGLVHLAGASAARLPGRELARRASYLFQDPEAGFLAEQVEDELHLGLDRTERPRADAVAERLGLPLGRFGARSPYTLSGGEQRRLSLAVSLARGQPLLMLDEPTYGQDRAGYETLVAILRERVAAGTALIAATHDLRFAGDLAGRSVALRNGRIAHDGPIRDLLVDTAVLRALGLAPARTEADLR